MLIFDSRWIGQHGIGRFAREIRRRLNKRVIDIQGNDPVSFKGLLQLEYKLSGYKFNKTGSIMLSPSYTPPIIWPGPFVFTIHDLIHMDVDTEHSCLKELYYKYVVKPAIFRSKKVLTVSEYSRQRILQWSGVRPEQVIVVGNGVDSSFSAQGPRYQPGYSYIFYVCNTKPHKNIPRLLEAFAQLDFPDLRLMLSGKPDEDIYHLALRLGIFERVIFAGRIPEEELAAYYRGAAVVTMPSLYEGFGLPALEGMACGVPVVVSNTTSLPEVVGDAGILVDPQNVESIAAGLTLALTDQSLRERMIERGLERAKLFNWDEVGRKVNQVLEKI